MELCLAIWTVFIVNINTSYFTKIVFMRAEA